MLKGSSANRMTKIKVYEGGKCIKTITNASINYGQDFEQLRKMVEIAIRLSPQDPIYNVEKIYVANEGKDLELDQGELEQFQSVLFRPENQLVGQKVALSIHVGGKKGRPSNRQSNDSENQENSGDLNLNKEPTITSATTKVESVHRAGSPVTKRATTPNKLRSVSRTRCSVAVPGGSGATLSNNSINLPRGMSPARSAVRQLSANSRPISELMGVSVGSTAAVVTEEPLAKPPTEEIPVVAKDEDAIPAVPVPATPVMENTPAVTEEKGKDLLVQYEAIIQEMEQKSRETIESTWMEVSGDVCGNSPMSVKTLAPFAYYSPPPPPSIPVKLPAPPVVQTVVTTDLEVAANTPLPPSEEVEVLVASVPPCTPPRAGSSENLLAAFGDDISVASANSNSTSNGHNNYRSKTPVRSAKKSMLYAPASAAKTPSKSANTATITSAGATMGKTPVFPDGRTLRESSLCYENSLRSYGNNTNVPATVSSAKKKKPRSNMNDGELSPIFQRSKGSSHHRDAEGRPSIGTITTQWEFMRTNFVNNSDEELEWLMVSKKTGAYNYANKKNEQAEDRYFRSLYEVDFYETKIKYFAGPSAKIPVMISELNAMYNVLLATPKDENAIHVVATQHARLVEAMHACEKEHIFAAFDPKIEQNVLAMLQETDRFKIVRKARDIHSNLMPEITALQGKLIKARKDGEEALKNMEKWSKRCMEAEEYPAVMRAQEQTWMEKEFEENMTAYRTMRAYFPPNIADITVNDVAAQYHANGGLVSMELAQELKTNKFLQWLETHPDDIAYENFLSGEKKAYFENLESMDVIELRALATVLPMKFELDNDGKKSEWRTRFFNRLKQLVSQQKREKVKGAWDSSKNARALVDLPPLKNDLLRRPIYFFRTKEQSDLKLKQFDDKLELLSKKKKWLETAEKEAKDAKEEYDTVLKEMRDPDFIEMYGADQLASVKDLAKTEWANAEKKRKTLAQDVDRLQKGIDASPFTREQFLDKENELERFLLGKGILWAEKGVAPVLIEGVFADIDKPLEKRIKAAAKFLSAEEEAATRKMELENLKARSMMVNATDIPDDELALADPMATVLAGNDSAHINNNEKSHNSTVVPVTSVIEINATAAVSTSSVAAAVASVQDALAGMSMAPSTPVAKTPRKHSILTHTNPELLNTLNKMFASPTPSTSHPSINSALRARTPNRRASVTIGATSTVSTATATADPDAPKEVKKSKSKLLKKLLGTTDEESAPGNDNNNSMMGLAATLPPGGFGGPGARPMSAMAIAMAGRVNPFDGGAAAGAAGGGLSFLDQIKARRAKTEDAVSTTTATGTAPVATDNNSNSTEVKGAIEEETSAPAPRRTFNPFAAAAAGPAGGGMSFLDQIKARRKNTDE